MQGRHRRVQPAEVELRGVRVQVGLCARTEAPPGQDYQLEVGAGMGDDDDGEGHGDDAGLRPLQLEVDRCPRSVYDRHLRLEAEGRVRSCLEVVEAERRGLHSWEGGAPGLGEVVAPARLAMG